MRKIAIVVIAMALFSSSTAQTRTEVKTELPDKCVAALEYGANTGLILHDQVAEYERLINECYDSVGRENIVVNDPVPITSPDQRPITTTTSLPPGNYGDGSSPAGNDVTVADEDEAFFVCQEEGYGEEYCLEYWEDFLE